MVEYVYLTSAFSTLLKERNAQSITDSNPRQTSLTCLLLLNIMSNIVLAGRNLSKCCNWRGWLPPEPCHWARCREGRPRWWAHCKDSLPTTRSPPSRRPEVGEVSYFYRHHYRYCVSLQTLTCWTRGCRREETPPRAPAQWMDPGLRTVKFNSPDCSQVRKLRILFSHDANFNFPFCRFEMYCVCETDAQRETLHTRNICLICEVLKDAFCGGSSLSGPPSPSSACWQ